jgi:hypothetical protein
MRRIIVSTLALASIVAAPAAARAEDPVTTTVNRIERISYPALGCRQQVHIHERYRLRYTSTTYADGTYTWSRSMRGTVRFREDGQPFRGRFVERSATDTVDDPGSYRLDRRVRATADDGTTLFVVERERTLLPAGEPPEVQSRSFDRTCA